MKEWVVTEEYATILANKEVRISTIEENSKDPLLSNVL